MNLERKVVTRAEAGIMFGITEREFTAWLSKDAVEEYKRNPNAIPPMPHFPGTPVMFPSAELWAWRKKHFLVGGDREEAA